MKRGGKYITAFFALVLFVLVSGVFLEGFPTSAVWWQRFYEMPEGEIDVVFLGSSHSYCTFDPDILDEKMGCNTIQIGSGSLDLVPLSYYVQEVFQYQTPCLIVIEAYSFCDKRVPGEGGQGIDSEVSRDNAMKAMRWGKNRIKGNLDMFGRKAALKKMLPFWDNHANWQNLEYMETRLRYLIRPNVADSEDRYEKSQSVMSEKTAKAYYDMKPVTTQWEMREDQKEAFHTIMEICRQNETQVILVMAPIYKEWRSHVNYESRHSQIQELADEYGVQFLDYNDKELYDSLNINEKHFRDDKSLDKGNTHLNTIGAELISFHFGSYIRLLWETEG